MIHLDTTLLVDLLREARAGGEEGLVDPARLGPAHRFLSRHADERMAVSIFTVCELIAGAARSRSPEQERAAVTSLLAGVSTVYPDLHFASVYGELFSELRNRGEAISAFDLLIGAAARADDAPLATRNTSDFERIPGLRVVSYWAER